MLKAALELLQKTAQNAQSIREIGRSPDGREAWFDAQGQWIRQPLAPACRAHVVYTVNGLLAYAAAVQKAAEAFPMVVWHSHNAVTLVLDDTDRRDVVACPLKTSRQFGWLTEASGLPVVLSQQELILALRFTFDTPPELIAPFRRLDWSTKLGSGSYVTERGESLGKEINAQVNSVDGLPAEIVLDVPVYENLGETARRSVRCMIQPIVRDQKFAVAPPAGELARLVDEAQQSIHQRLVEGGEGIPVYYGAP